MPDQTEAFDNLPLDDLRQLDELCARFESAWTDGVRPVLEDYLQQVAPAARGELLRELLFVEIEQRRRQSEMPTREEYQNRFAADEKIIDQAWQRLETDRPAGIKQGRQHASGDTTKPALDQTLAEHEAPLASEPMSHLSQVSLWEGPGDENDHIVKPASPEVPGDGELGNHYQLHGEIARGGMGAIIKGRDTSLGRDLAIKVLLESHRDKPQILQRFVEEAQIGGQLQHPGIVPVYELGQFRDRRPFFSMKLVKGETLSALLTERPDPRHDRARFLGIFEQVCQTVAYAHSRGVIHRDLKPSNIMVGAFGEVQVMDWGLAKVLQQGGIADEKKAKSKLPAESIVQTVRSEGSDTPGVVGSDTRVGSVMGTPAYMSPEQALGEVDMLDERCDVFSLGAVLCEILTGQPPYVAEDAAQTHRMATRGKLDDAWRRLDECEADEELCSIARRCLAPETDKRPRNAGAVATEVTAYLESVEARLQEAEVERARAELKAEEEIKRRRVGRALIASLSAASLLLVLLTCGVAVAAVYYRNQEQAQQKLAEEKGALATKNGNLAKSNGDLAESNGELAKRNERLFQEKAHEAEIAVAAREEAESARRMAEAERSTALSNLYYARMTLAHEVIRNPSGYGQLEGTIQKIREFRTWQDPRGWEWRYWQSLMHQDAMTLHGHLTDVLAVAWSRDGRWLASAGQDKRIRIWDAQTGTQQRYFAAPDGVFDLAWHPDNRSLASANHDGTAVVWDSLTGRPISIMKGHTGRVNALAWHTDGRRLVTGGLDHTIRTWDAVEGEQLTSIQTDQTVASVAWSPDGERLASASFDREVHLWDASTGELAVTCRGHASAVNSVAFSPDGGQLASGGDDHVVNVWDATSGELEHSLIGHTDAVNSVAFSPNGERLLSGSTDRTVRVWAADSGREILTLGGHRAPVQCVVWSPDGKRMASGASGFNGVVKVWDANPVLPQRMLRAHEVAIRSVAWSPNGQRIASCGADQSVRIWEADRLTEVAVLQDHKQETTAVAFSLDGKHIASGDASGRIILWNAETFEADQPQFAQHGETIRRLQWSPDSQTLVSSGAGATSIWSIADGKRLQRYGPAGELNADGTKIAIAERNNVRILKTSTGRVVEQWPTSVERHRQFSWDPGDHWMAADSGESIMMFNDGWLMEALEGHIGRINSFSFSPDGERIASGGADDKILIFGDSGVVTMLRGHEAEVNSLAWSRDGTQIVSGDAQGVIRVWDARQGFYLDTPPALRPGLDARLAAQPDDLDALQLRAVTFARDRQWVEAAADFERIAELKGDQAPSFFSTGWWVATKFAKTGEPSLERSPGEMDSRSVAPFHLDDSLNTYMTGRRPRWYWTDRDPNGFIPWETGYEFTMARLYAPQACAITWTMFGQLNGMWLNGWYLSPEQLPIQLQPGWNTLVFEVKATGQRNFPGILGAVRVSTQQETRPPQPLRIWLTSERERVARAYRYGARRSVLRQRWVPAADRLIKAVELDPDVPSAEWLQAAAILIENRDLETYRKLLPNMLEHFANRQNDATTCDQIAKACLFPPPAESQLPDFALQQAMAMADRAVEIRPGFSWYQLCKGLAELRADRYEDAAQWLDRCLPPTQQANINPYMKTAASFAGAIANHRLGRTARAHELYKMGAAVLEGGLPNISDNWPDEFIANSLHREARTLLGLLPLPGDTLDRMRRGIEFAKLGRLERAHDEFSAIEEYFLVPDMLDSDTHDPTEITIAKLRSLLSRQSIDGIDPVDIQLAYAGALGKQGNREEQIEALRAAFDLQKLSVIEVPIDSSRILDINDLACSLATALRAAGRDADVEQVAVELHRFLIAFRVAAPDRVAARFPQPAQLTPVPTEESLEALDRLLEADTPESGSPDGIEEELTARLHRRHAELLRLVASNARMNAFKASLATTLENSPGSREQNQALAKKLEFVPWNPEDPLTNMRSAIICAYTENLDQFHELCSDALDRFAGTSVPDFAEKIAKACLTAPPREDNLAAASKLADLALTLDPDYWNGTFIPWAQLTKALAEHRLGNHQAAIAWVEKCLAHQTEDSSRKALCQGILAMAHGQLDDSDAAQQAETELLRILKEHSPLHAGGDFGDAWHDWLVCEVFLREIRQARGEAAR